MLGTLDPSSEWDRDSEREPELVATSSFDDLVSDRRDRTRGRKWWHGRQRGGVGHDGDPPRSFALAPLNAAVVADGGTAEVTSAFLVVVSVDGAVRLWHCTPFIEQAPLNIRRQCVVTVSFVAGGFAVGHVR
jgi:hypothetical protein